MSEKRKPLWKHRIPISRDRNITIVVWPPGEYEGKPTPPSIVIEENRREEKGWETTRINLTLDKLPNMVLGLVQAYSKALEVSEK